MLDLIKKNKKKPIVKMIWQSLKCLLIQVPCAVYGHFFFYTTDLRNPFFVAVSVHIPLGL